MKIWIDVTCLACAVVAFATTARAQTPKFEYAKPEEVKKVEWKASAQAGFIVTTGNSRTTTVSAGANASRKAGCDKFSAEASIAYARSNILIAQDLDAMGDPGFGTIGPDEITEDDIETAKAWSLKARYDRFFTTNNSLFASARAAADEPAGKELIAGGQVGYSRQLYKDKVHELVSEAGYDFTYEDYVAAADAVSIHSLRLFAGYTLAVSGATGVQASMEALFNLNTEETPSGDVDPFEDARLLGKASLTTKLSSKVSFRFAFTIKVDLVPAPRAPFAIPYDPGFLPLADEVDTTTEASLIVNIL